MAEEKKEYALPLEKFKAAGIDVKEGTRVGLNLGDNKTATARVMKIEGDTVTLALESK